eukprot:TRINITY_DN1726_c0_g1_i3.p1 TRINITY_DN1726_c0_g1~~TRINITY_DN1726_c0_g1_i3.p1  ORF type:complete len:489 (-),score=107.50 TRINITY_DN1726_c0_g1_i3:119-1393(-)
MDIKQPKPVIPSHQRTERGVRFNVETVVEGKEPSTYYEKVDAAKIAAAFYQDKLLDSKVEVTSFTRDQPKFATTGLAGVVLEAFNRHLPLVLRPDDIWLVLAYSFSKHVEKHAEELRKNFVKHEGKKTLKVFVNHFVLGQMKPENWERDVFPDFSKQIKENVGEQVHSTIAGGFSSTTAVDQAAHEITLMAAMKQYFSYEMSTLCGIPWIELQGTEDDWKVLRERAKHMCSLMMPEAGKEWLSFLEPVLNEFVNSYQGQVNHHFWQGIVKWVQHGEGSGSYSTVSGWITILYHELSSHHKPWDQMVAADGPKPEKFPKVLSSAPVTWFYLEKTLPLHFHAGIVGGNWDPQTNAVSCHIGWIVSHDPPQDPEERTKILSRELNHLKENESKDWKTKNRIQKIEEHLESLKSGKPIQKDGFDYDDY